VRHTRTQDSRVRSKTKHEGGDDDRHRLDIDAEDKKQCALPGELIDQGRKPEKKNNTHQHMGPMRELRDAADVGLRLAS
jgi:hypothetical protein